MEIGGVKTYTHGGLKNTDRQTNASRATTAAKTYDAFGNLILGTGTWVGPFDYAGDFGYQQDASGLMLLGHRYYDSYTGRFLTRDPIEDGRNWYGYGGGYADPVNGVDPEGLFVKTVVGDIAGGVASGGAATGAVVAGGIIVAAVGGWTIGQWIDRQLGISEKLGNLLGGNVDSLPADPKPVKNGKNFNKGRGDDPAYNMTEQELLDAIAAAKKAGDTKRMRQLEKIYKEKFKGHRAGS